MNLELYTFEDADGMESGFSTRDIAEARTYARVNGLKLIANIFEWSDSETIEDNTPERSKRRAKGGVK